MVKSFGMVVLQALEVDFYLLDNVFWVSDTTLNGNDKIFQLTSNF